MRPTTVPMAATASAALPPTESGGPGPRLSLEQPVAARIGGAEPMRRAGRQGGGEATVLGKQDFGRIVGGEPIGEDRDEQEAEIDRGADERIGVAQLREQRAGLAAPALCAGRRREWCGDGASHT